MEHKIKNPVCMCVRKIEKFKYSVTDNSIIMNHTQGFGQRNGFDIVEPIFR